MRSAFVTGATGLLGSNLVRVLRARGVAVTALVRSPAKAERQLAGLGVDIVTGDLGDVDGFAGKLAGCDVLFHTGAYFRESYKGGRHADALLRINVEGTRQLLAAALAHGVTRVIHVSSIAVFGSSPDPGTLDERHVRSAEGEPDPYYRSKILADEAVRAFVRENPQLSATLVAPGFMWGPGDLGPTSAGQLYLDFVGGRLPFVFDASFSVVDARDVALAMTEAVARGTKGALYVVAGRRMTVTEIAAVLERVTGIPAPRRRLPFPLLLAVAAANELVARATGREVLISWTGARTMWRSRNGNRFDSSRAARELGVAFRPLEQTFADVHRWFQAQGR
jgi:dihydroflavonol-4-reductase